MERLISQTPQNTSEFVQQPWPDGFLPPEPARTTFPDLRGMNAEKLLDYISNDLAGGEQELYRDYPDIESKLAFLGGSGKWDISDLTTTEGKTIYRTVPPFMKNSEIHEFVVVANLVTNEHVPVVDFANEAADVFYNLIRCQSLDDYDNPPDYLKVIDDISSTLGWSRKEAFLLASAKFHKRFVERKGKDPEGEREVTEGLFTVDRYVKNARPYVSTPSMDKINRAAKLMLRYQQAYIMARYNLIRFEKEMGRSRYKKPKIVFGQVSG